MMQEVYELLYADSSFIAAYHNSRGCTHVSISDWDQGVRTVSFELQLTQAPALITSMIGTHVQAIDKQTLQWADAEGHTVEHSDNGAATRFDVSSSPELQMSGGKRFSTKICIGFQQQGRCVHVVGSLEVAAHVWGMAGSLEPAMLKEGKQQMAQFFEFAEYYYYSMRKPSKAALAPSPPSSDTIAPEPLPASPRSGGTDRQASADDELQTQPSVCTSPQLPRRSRELQPSSSDERFEDVMESFSSSGVRAEQLELWCPACSVAVVALSMW